MDREPEDLNANGTLFDDSLLRWIDERAASYAIIQLGNQRALTKPILEINAVASARQGDMIEMGLKATAPRRAAPAESPRALHLPGTNNGTHGEEGS